MPSELDGNFAGFFLDACYVDACFVVFFVDRVFFEAPKCPNLDIFGGDTAGFAMQFAPEIRQTNDAQWLRRCTTKMIDDVWQNQRKVASISKINSVNSLHTYKHTSQFLQHMQIYPEIFALHWFLRQPLASHIVIEFLPLPRFYGLP